MRKSRSAAVQQLSSPEDGGSEGDAASESRRPYTAAVSSPTKFSAKKTMKPSAKRTATPACDQRPRSAGLNGWGDFDTDWLLQDDNFFAAGSLLDEADGVLSAADKPPPNAAEAEPERARSRRARYSAPAPTVHNNPVEDFPSAFDAAHAKASREQPRPATHVLRQRPLAVVDFDAAQPLRSKTPALASRGSALRGRIHPPTGGGPPPTPPELQTNRLPRLARTLLSSTESLALTPLFGASIPDSRETRALVFERFRSVWDLMSSRPSPASPARDAGPAQTRSPLECSMTLMKICKTVGISLDSVAAAPPTLAFWSARDHDVDFQSFCDYALRSAIQPALHHFRADVSVGEFAASVDRILENLVTSAGHPLSPEVSDAGASGSEEPRLKELAEIRSLFPRWKAGASSLGQLKVGTRGTSSRPETPPSAPAESQQEDARAGLTAPLFPSRRELTLQPPTSEAKAAHDESIRRKVQLHKSWQTRSVLLTTSASAAALQAVRDSSVAAAAAGAPHALSRSPLRTNADRGVLHHSTTAHAAALGRLALEARAGGQGSAPAPVSEHAGDQNTAVGSSEERSSAPTDAPPPLVTAPCPVFEDVLVCGACADADAALWCAPCFSVFCIECWQRRHLLRVDASATCAPLAPSAKQLKPQTLDSCGGGAGPPFAMIYLSTKPLAIGKLARGGVSRRPPQELIAAAAIPAVSSHALLPPLLLLPPPPSKKTTADTFESTSNLVRALMLGAAAPLAPSSSHATSSSPSPAAVRTYADPPRRARLRPAPVLLDAARLLQP